MKLVVYMYIVLCCVTLCTPAQAVVFDMTTYWDGSQQIGAWGEGTTNIYGQTFRSPNKDSVLDFVSLYINDFVDPDYIDFGFYVMAWDSINGRATGNILYNDGVEYYTTNNHGLDGFESFTFYTDGLQLTPGNEYVFFLNVYDFRDGITGAGTVGIVDNYYTDGDFVYLGGGPVGFPELIERHWQYLLNNDFAFTAEFSAPTANTPIPGAVWLLGSGLLGLIGIKRRRRA